MRTIVSYPSITRKLIMGLFGLFLAIFLLVHMSINLLLVVGDEGALFMKASEFMKTNWFIKVFEYVLFFGFFVHIAIGIVLTLMNWKSRPVRYLVSNKSHTSFFSKYMFHTGVIIFIFLIFHFIHFFFVKIGWVDAPAAIDKHDFYSMAVQLFTNVWYSVIYIAFFIFLGFHLNHSIQSGLQTLGFNHNKYNKAVKIISTAYALIISVGFSIIPLYFIFIY